MRVGGRAFLYLFFLILVIGGAVRLGKQALFSILSLGGLVSPAAGGPREERLSALARVLSLH